MIVALPLTVAAPSAVTASIVVAPVTFKPACKSAAPSAVKAAIVVAPSTFNVRLTSALPLIVALPLTVVAPALNAPLTVAEANVDAPAFNVPVTEASPPTEALPVVITLLNVTSSVVATDCPIAISPVGLIDTPVPSSR